MTGNDRISAEFKGKQPFSFRSNAKLVFAGNTLPQIKDTDVTKAFSNRMAVLLFNHSIPKDKQDKNLLTNLWEERDAIFSKAIHALAELEERNFVFQMPEESIHFRENFLGQNDTTGTFIKDNLTFDTNAKVANDVLYPRYLAYCKEQSKAPIGKTELFTMLENYPEVSRTKSRCNTPNPVHCFKGISLAELTIREKEE